MPEPVLESHSEDSNRVHEGIDRYWGLGVVVLLTSFLSTLVLANSAFFYVHLKETYDVDYGTALWPLTVLWIFSRAVGPLVYWIQKWVPVHGVGLAGSVLAWLGLVLAGFAPSITWVTVSLGALHGAGMGAVLICFSICTATYFSRYRTTIESLKYVGSSAAGVLGPLSLAFLVQRYGLNRALILAGVVVMNISPLTLFLKTPEAAGCDCFRKISSSKSRRLTVTSRLLDGNIPVKYSEPRHLESFHSMNNPFDAGSQTGYSTSAGMQLSVRRVQPSEELCEDFHCSRDPHLELNESTPASETVSSCLTDAEDRSQRFIAETLPPRRGSNSYLPQNTVSIFKLRAFYTLALIYVVVDYTNFGFRATMVAYGIDKGISRTGAEYLIMCDAIGSLFGRLVLTRLLSCLQLRQGTAYALCLVAFSASLVAFSFLRSQTAVICIVVVTSLPSGFLLAMKPGMAAHFLGTDMAGAGWIVTGACVLPFILANPVLTGFFHDRMGSFDNLYRLFAAFNIFGAVLLLLQRLLKKCAPAGYSECGE